MNEKYIEQEHLFNKKIIEEFNVKKGTKMTFKYYDELKDTTIDWINSYYGWFGSDTDGWILPDLIVSINGLDVKDKITAIRKEVYKEEVGGKEHEDVLFREKNPF
jgi:hypothetical protein